MSGQNINAAVFPRNPIFFQHNTIINIIKAEKGY